MNSRILPFFALIIAIGIFFFYVNPTWTGSIRTARATISANNAALDAVEQYKKRQNQLAAARDAIDPAFLAKLNEFLPDSVDNVGLILDLNALSARSGLTVSNIDVVTSSSGGSTSNSGNAGSASAKPSTGGALTAGAPANPAKSVDLTLSAAGTFSALQTFLIGVEKSSRLLDVHDLVIKGSDTGVYQYQMSIRLYWLR